MDIADIIPAEGPCSPASGPLWEPIARMLVPGRRLRDTVMPWVWPAYTAKIFQWGTLRLLPTTQVGKGRMRGNW